VFADVFSLISVVRDSAHTLDQRKMRSERLTKNLIPGPKRPVEESKAGTSRAKEIPVSPMRTAWAIAIIRAKDNAQSRAIIVENSRWVLDSVSSVFMNYLGLSYAGWHEPESESLARLHSSHRRAWPLL
jgi:hypothetical protein